MMTTFTKIKYLALALVCLYIPSLCMSETLEVPHSISALKMLAQKKGYSNDLLSNLTGDKTLQLNYKYPSASNQNLGVYEVPNAFCKDTTTNILCTPETYKYRTIDGTCNNLVRTWYGAAGTPMKRILSPQYDDGVSAIRAKSVVDGYYLPNPRIVTATLQPPQPTRSVWSNFLITFGQSVAHEMAHTYNGDNGKCDCNNPLTLNDDCISVPISGEYDNFYAQNNVKCYSFVRSLPSFVSYDCTLGPREQTNLHSAWLDLSFIYGPNSAGPDSNEPYLLKYSRNAAGEEMFALRSPTGCAYADRASVYVTPDTNAEQNVYQTTSQVIWLRYHNYIARKLKAQNNGRLTDQQLFKEAKRINIAAFQHIVYNEYLPNMIGFDIMQQNDLVPLTWGYYNGYSADVYPQIYNEFATAAFRLHHLVGNKQCWADQNYVKSECHDIYYGMLNSTQSCYSSDYVIRGQLATWSYYSANQVSFVMNNLLLKSYDSIGTKNILRGRDHGLRGYIYYREWCGLGLARSFDDLIEIPPPVRAQLSKLYYKVEDIDLWVGGVLELPIHDGFIGPTFSCLVAKQFNTLKRGDRFYYENGQDVNSRFTLDQLNSVRGLTISSVLCRTVNVANIPKWPFLYPDAKSNPFLSCNAVPEINLAPWLNVPY